jgi:predicted lipoprotein
LFRQGTGNACAAARPINANGTWAALIADGDALLTRRAAYVGQAARDIVLRAQELVRAWDPNDGNFFETFVGAGDGSAVFESDQAALNALNEALYFLEVDVKDYKLAQPLGITAACAPDCTSLAESPLAAVSTDNLRQNLIGMRRLFQGCGPRYSGLGFDDWLIDVERADLATAMVAALESTQAAIDAVDPPLEQAVAGDNSEVQAVYTAVKSFTDLLKIDFITVLNLEPPEGSVGDND